MKTTTVIFTLCCIFYSLALYGQTDLNIELIDEVALNLKNSFFDEVSSFTNDQNQSNHQIRLGHYHFNVGSQDGRQRFSQTTIASRSDLSILGVGLQLESQLFLSNYQFDNTRSGIGLSYSRINFLRKLEESDSTSDIVSRIRENIYEDQLNESDRLRQAQDIVHLEKCLALFDNPAYQSYVTDTQQRHDLAVRDSLQLSEEEMADLVSRQDTIEMVGALYDSLLQRAKLVPHDIRMQAHEIVASAGQAGESADNHELLKRLTKSDALNIWQKLSLFTNQFSIGLTSLPVEHFSSAGLPINGIDLGVDVGKFQVAFTLGRKQRSNHFLPQDGVLFHDRLPDYKVWRVGLKFNENYGFSVQQFKEKGRIATGENPIFPRQNTVLSFSGRTDIIESISLISEISQSETNLISGSPFAALNPQNLSQTASRFAIAWDSKNLNIEAGAFRIGANYQSFGNPYLITNFEGAEIRLASQTDNGRLSSDFQISIGNNTSNPSPSNPDNFRLQCRGHIQYKIGKNQQVGLLVAPNMFRREVNNQDAFSEANIYRLWWRGRTGDGPECVTAYLAATNVVTGLSWQDSTNTSQSVVLQSQVDIPIGLPFNIGLNGRQTIGQITNSEFAYNLSVGLSGRYHCAISTRYDRYRWENSPVLGASIQFDAPLSAFGRLHVFLNYRPGRENTSEEFSGQQNIQFNL
ncbi:MAG: hypothetical protein AAFY36_15655 [Bacteroidota bacterium]